MQTSLSSFLQFIFSVELKDLKCANAKYDIKQAGISGVAVRGGFPNCVHPRVSVYGIQMPFCGRHAFSRQMHTAVIYLFMPIVARMVWGTSISLHLSVRVRECVCVWDVNEVQ